MMLARQAVCGGPTQHFAHDAEERVLQEGAIVDARDGRLVCHGR
jgi:hypothetical protein